MAKFLNKNKFEYLIVFSILFFLSPVVTAFGAAVSYWDGNELRIDPGESAEFDLRLQNMVGNEDITVKAEIIGGLEIAKIIDEKNLYEVPFGTRDRKVNVRVEIPKNAEIGKKYDIVIELIQVTSGDGGTVALAGGVVNNIPVIVGKTLEQAELSPETQQEKGISTKIIFTLLTLTSVLAFIVILVIVYFVVRRNQNFVQNK